MRPESTELQIECPYCRHFTQSINPIVIKKIKGNRYQISAKCIICKRTKGKTLNKTQVKELPNEIKNSEYGSIFANEIERKGSAFPLALLLPLITAGIRALPDIGKTIYNAVKGNGINGENKEELLNKRMDSGEIALKEICEKRNADYYD